MNFILDLFVIDDVNNSLIFWYWGFNCANDVNDSFLMHSVLINLLKSLNNESSLKFNLYLGTLFLNNLPKCGSPNCINL